MKQKIISFLHKPCITFSWLSAFLYGLFFILMLVTIANKENYHIDEMATFKLANYSGKSHFATEKQTYIPAEQPYIDMLTVPEKHRFKYSTVWKNQKRDVHPPFYYALIHTICSVFYKDFSEAPAAAVNIIFALLTLWAFRQVVRGLTNKDPYICALLSLAFILSTGILSNISFYRMYVVAMFWVTLLSALFIKELDAPKIDKYFLIKFYLIVVLGSLTHYYCIVFATFICAVFGLYLLCQKRWGCLGRFIGVGIVALGSIYAIFPATFKHLFFSYRGQESFSNLAQSLSEYWEKLKIFYSIINKDVFGGFFGYLVLGLFVLIILSFILQKGRLLFSKNEMKKYALILIPIFLYFFVIAKIAVYNTDRYMFPIYAIIIGSVFSLASMIVLKVIKNKISYVILAAALLTLVVHAYQIASWTYLYKKSVPFLSETKKYGDTDCLYVATDRWKMDHPFKEIKNYRSFTFISEDHLDDLKQLVIAKQKKLIVLIIDDNQMVLKKIMSKYPQLTHYQKLGSFGYTTTYYLYGNK